MRAALLLALAAALPAHAALPIIAGHGWQHPGRSPDAGPPEAALAASHLPADVQRRIAERIHLRDADGRVYFRRDAIVSADGEVFADSFDMSERSGLAVGQHVAFDAGRTEGADLYRDGPYTVAVADVCGNLAVLYRAGTPHVAHPHPALPAVAPVLPPWLGGPPAQPWGYMPAPGIGPSLPAVPPTYVGPAPIGTAPPVLPPAERPIPEAPTSPVSAPGTLALIAAGIVAASLRKPT